MRLYELILKLISSVLIYVEIIDHPQKLHFSGTVNKLRFEGSWFYDPYSMSKVRNISIEHDILCIYCEDN